MNICIATSNPEYIKILKKNFHPDDSFSIIRSKEETQNMMDSVCNQHHSDVFSCDILFLDYSFYPSLLLSPYGDELLFFPIVLICDAVEDVQLQYVSGTKTMMILPLRSITPKAIHIQIQFLLNNFKHFIKIQTNAFVDSLTGIFNRRAFENNLEKFLNNYKLKKQSFCLAYIDLDDFKFINDTFGHIKGDEILKILAKIMQKNCRCTDILARLGGEEFAIIFPDTEIEQAYNILERIRLYIEQTNEIDDMVRVTLSAGLVKGRMEYNSYNDLIRDADILLYKAKDLGKNRICM